MNRRLNKDQLLKRTIAMRVEKKYKADEMAKEAGHDVIRRHLNPI